MMAELAFLSELFLFQKKLKPNWKFSTIDKLFSVFMFLPY